MRNSKYEKRTPNNLQKNHIAPKHIKSFFLKKNIFSSSGILVTKFRVLQVSTMILHKNDLEGYKISLLAPPIFFNEFQPLIPVNL